MALPRPSAPRPYAALILAVVIAMTWLLPNEPPGTVAQAGDWFSAAQLARAEHFRGVQRLLTLADLVIPMLVLSALVWRPPVWLRAARRPLVAAALFGAGLVVVVTAVSAPIAAIGRVRAHNVGLVTGDWVQWAGDLAITTGTSAAFAGAGTAIALALVRRLPNRWWIPAAAVIVAYATASVMLSPLIIDPLQHSFTAAPTAVAEPTRELASRAGVVVGEILVMDASRRTNAANAYVAGLGPTKRVVFYDTLLRDFPSAQQRAVIAHELAHVKNHDLRNGLLLIALVAPLGMFAVAGMTRALAQREWDRGTHGAGPRPGPGVLPALVLSVAVVATASSLFGNGVSRAVEARADGDALALTAEPEPFIAFQRAIAVQNVADPSPPMWWRVLFGTHPSTLERIGYGVAARARMPQLPPAPTR